LRKGCQDFIGSTPSVFLDKKILKNERQRKGLALKRAKIFSAHIFLHAMMVFPVNKKLPAK